ncbi:cytochrome c oxidase accessory protein CcoG [Roseateles cavernae]|uniref:cytochrome c oxidase accessory protein CcoG n=1 Tax=Roseateles cavernae TaxID=3153578 RepID=UPI0032E37668
MSVTRKVIPLLSVPGGVEPELHIQARSVRGLFARWRWSLVWLTQLLFYGLPWLQWDGRQALLFDLEARRFYMFAAVLFPQDLIYLTGLLVFSALLLFFATAIAGRVWCGFACPQTVYTEIFMWIEHRFEGDRRARLRLDAAGWGADKLGRRGGKHLAWLGFSLLTGFSLVGWFTPIRELVAALPALGPWEMFWTLFYGAATYLHAGLLREKVCQHACPYGRFQGSMLDPATLVVSYDEVRGEPRGARSRGVDARALSQGDCVDCSLCVQVCPVGIDIRQGLQAACISCGLCIDACNQVMDKLRAPRGLIRFSALQGHASQRRAGPAWLRPRVLVYGSLLMLLGAALVWAWLARPALRMNVLRDRAVLSRRAEDGAVENLYRLQLMNASLQARRLSLQASTTGAEPLALQLAYRGELQVEPAGTSSTVVTLRMAEADAQRLASGKPLPIRFELRDAQGKSVETVRADSTFMLR